MESKYYVKEENGMVQNIYTNETYDLTICTNGNVNLGRKTVDSDAIINQLIEDLSRTTIKMQTMINVIENGAKQGFVSAEYAEQLSEYVYGSENNKPLKK